MRIQHNITAMNAYRNYNHNTSAISKNLEKLSSGYKINRAGDDAAGLAVSQKMRLQIAGLAQAQKNAKSGISLVQTAEGALTEVHDMLERMYTIAEQSANGTFDESTDRAQLQKELESLQTEITRIGKTANFNGIGIFKEYEGAGAASITSVDAKSSGGVPASTQSIGKSKDATEDELTGTANNVIVTSAKEKAGKTGDITTMPTINNATVTNGATADGSNKVSVEKILAVVNEVDPTATGAVTLQVQTDAGDSKDYLGIYVGDTLVAKATAEFDGANDTEYTFNSVKAGSSTSVGILKLAKSGGTDIAKTDVNGADGKGTALNAMEISNDTDKNTGITVADEGKLKDALEAADASGELKVQYDGTAWKVCKRQT